VTAEIAVHLATSEARPGDFEWRVSTALVDADGPFSVFPGCERWIVALDGGGFALDHSDGRGERSVTPREPYAFSGDAMTTCRLSRGPVRDLGVIARRDVWRARVRWLEAPAEMRELRAAVVLLYCAEGPLRVRLAGLFGAIELTAGDCLRVDVPEQGAAELAVDSVGFPIPRGVLVALSRV
jgi:environmental stress-induced protein Ves